jgi:tetratricopeptide (TPR) repeat protein
MRRLCLKAIELDRNCQMATAILGTTCIKGSNAIAHERALALNPNRVSWRFATALVHAGQHERAIEVIRACMRLDPFYPPTAPGFLGFAYFMLKRYSEALPPLLECTSRASGWQGGHLFLAATYARLGEIDKARAVAAEILRLIPEYTISGIEQRLNFYRRPEDAEHFFGGLRLAGLPE